MRGHVPIDTHRIFIVSVVRGMYDERRPGYMMDIFPSYGIYLRGDRYGE